MPATTDVRRGTTSIIDGPPPVTTLDRTPKPDDAEMFRVYNAMWQAYVWSASHPDDPRWDDLFAYVIKENREAFRKDITDRWAKGLVLEPGTGRTTNAHIFTRNPRSVVIYDCHVDGTVWVDKLSRQAVEPPDATPRPIGLGGSMDTADGRWFVVTISPDPGRSQSECAG